MRLLHKSVVTLIIVLLATIATASVNGQQGRKDLIPGFIPNGTDVPAPPADAPKIDASKIKFLLAGGCDERMFLGNPTQGRGIVAREIDLSDDLTARQILQMGITFVLEKCPSAKEPWVHLRSGDPAAFTNATEGFGFLRGNLYGYPSDVVSGGSRDEKPGLIVGYRNFAQAFKKQEAYYAEQERQRNAALEKQRRATQQRQASWAAFLKTHRVKLVVTNAQLAANPFVYQRQVVAVKGYFRKMISRTQGMFFYGDYSFVVSGISAARFTRPGVTVIFAGRVLGNIETEHGRLPHLSFVGVWFDD